MLSKRQTQILKAIVDEFTKTAQPVGSKRLLEILNIKVSSATLRNDMAYLEQCDLLEKTHTSSGRIPSSKGYRYYVEHLMERHLDEDLVKVLNEVFYNRQYSNEEILEECCKILSEITSLTGIVLGSDCKTQKLMQLQIVPVTSNDVVALIVTSDGTSQHKTFHLKQGMSASDIKECCDMLNQRLQGKCVCDIADCLKELSNEYKQTLNRYEALFQALITTFVKMNNEQNMYTSGKENMLDLPEFSSVEKVRNFLNLMNDSNLWREMASYNETLSIRIGNQESDPLLGSLSIVASSFAISKEEKGQIMIVGPTRMPYNKIISLLEYMSWQMEKIYKDMRR